MLPAVPAVSALPVELPLQPKSVAQSEFLSSAALPVQVLTPVPMRPTYPPVVLLLVQSLFLYLPAASLLVPQLHSRFRPADFL